MRIKPLDVLASVQAAPPLASPAAPRYNRPAHSTTRVRASEPAMKFWMPGRSILARPRIPSMPRRPKAWRGGALRAGQGGRFAWMVGLLLLAAVRIEAATNLVLWDSLRPLAEPAAVAIPADWKAVPAVLFSLEADPAKAASDPGYYGLEYSFRGDPVVENPHVLVTFLRAQGRVVVRTKNRLPPVGGRKKMVPGLGSSVVAFSPVRAGVQATSLSRIEIIRNIGDEVVLEVGFSGAAGAESSAVFAFDRSEIVEIRMGANMERVSLRSPLDYAVAPDFIGDDLIYGAADYPGADSLGVPAEQMLVGLLAGGNTALVMTWTGKGLPVSLRLATGSQGERAIDAVEFAGAGQSFFLAPLRAPGIWHQETLAAGHLEKDVKLPWQRPFPARWKTQLLEADLKTTFLFRESKGQIWRGVAGSYNYPAWFDDEDAFFRLGKKVPPKGEAIVYFLEGQDTPPAVTTPVDILKATLGRSAGAEILDAAGRKLRTHHRRGGEGVHRACTCGCTEVIQAIFEAGEEVERKALIQDALDDMLFFVDAHVARIEEYRRFADATIKFLQTQRRMGPELEPWLEALEKTVGRIPEECSVQQENMKSLSYAEDLTRRTLALTERKEPGNLKAYLELLKAWRDMGGAQDYVVAQCHTVVRKLKQEAGYGCATEPKAVGLALAIRARCRQVLRNPDGYEIWADY